MKLYAEYEYEDRTYTVEVVDTDGVDYKTGDLSLFPETLDDRKSLYLVANNAETKLKQPAADTKPP